MRALILVGLLIPACGGNIDNPGTSSGIGGSFGGINSSKAGFSGVGGDCICDALANTGGTTSAGGTTSTGGNQAIGCTGSFEMMQSNTGLCVAKMATISAPSGYADYQIDVTEVTKGQYDAWLASDPALPLSTDPSCGYVASYAEQGTGYTGSGADHHPVVFVDWCDAYAYCSGVGKRLCGAIGGGSVDDSVSFADATQSQWYRACTSGGMNTYPYGNAYEPSYCDGWDYWYDNSSNSQPVVVGEWASQTVAVGSLANCETSTIGYAGIFDLSGNAWEWEDSCDGSQPTSCHIRGGSFNDYSGNIVCGKNHGAASDYVDYSIGFRCCSQ